MIVNRNNQRQKLVNVKWTIELPMFFPEAWSDELIDFHLNDSSWCCDNLIEELMKYSRENGCICNICKAEINN